MIRKVEVVRSSVVVCSRLLERCLVGLGYDVAIYVKTVRTPCRYSKRSEEGLTEWRVRILGYKVVITKEYNNDRLKGGD